MNMSDVGLFILHDNITLYVCDSDLTNCSWMDFFDTSLLLELSLIDVEVARTAPRILEIVIARHHGSLFISQHTPEVYKSSTFRINNG